MEIEVTQDGLLRVTAEQLGRICLIESKKAKGATWKRLHDGAFILKAWTSRQEQAYGRGSEEREPQTAEEWKCVRWGMEADPSPESLLDLINEQKPSYEEPVFPLLVGTGTHGYRCSIMWDHHDGEVPLWEGVGKTIKEAVYLAFASWKRGVRVELKESTT